MRCLDFKQRKDTHTTAPQTIKATPSKRIKQRTDVFEMTVLVRPPAAGYLQCILLERTTMCN